MGLKGFFSRLKAVSTSRSSDRPKVDRAPRVRVHALHSMEFFPREVATSMQIENISASGLGLILPATIDATALDVIVGDLKINEDLFPLVLRVVRFNGDYVGTKIESPPSAFIAALNKYFQSEIAAIRLKPTRADILKPSANGTPHWYQGANNCELSYVSSGSEVIEFSITIFGNHLEGGRNRSLQLSTVMAQKPSDHRRGADLLEGVTRPDSDLLDLARRVVLAVEDLPADHRDSLLKLLI